MALQGQPVWLLWLRRSSVQPSSGRFAVVWIALPLPVRLCAGVIGRCCGPEANQAIAVYCFRARQPKHIPECEALLHFHSILLVSVHIRWLVLGFLPQTDQRRNHSDKRCVNPRKRSWRACRCEFIRTNNRLCANKFAPARTV